VIHKEDTDQQRVNALKTIRAIVRLKHSLAADNEINEVLPAAELHFNAALNKGKVLSIAEVKRAVGL
jgi:hypothetical protein